MRIRTFVAAAGITLAGAAALAATAGTASAFTPMVDPGNGIYAGVILNPEETAAVNNSPLPGILNSLAPAGQTIIALSPNSNLPQDDNYVYADTSDVLAEAAARHGAFGIALENPNRNGGVPWRVVEGLPQPQSQAPIF